MHCTTHIRYGAHEFILVWLHVHVLLFIADVTHPCFLFMCWMQRCGTSIGGSS